MLITKVSYSYTLYLNDVKYRQNFKVGIEW
jgi:hypothetical protein